MVYSFVLEKKNLDNNYSRVQAPYRDVFFIF